MGGGVGWGGGQINKSPTPTGGPKPADVTTVVDLDDVESTSYDGPPKPRGWKVNKW